MLRVALAAAVFLKHSAHPGVASALLWTSLPIVCQQGVADRGDLVTLGGQE
jgi:hypothetical protein